MPNTHIVSIFRDPVEKLDKGLYIKFDSGLLPLMAGGKIVESFLPGWRASILYVGFLPLLLLELVHEDGRVATWFLNLQLEQIADSVDALGPDLLNLLRKKAIPVINSLICSILEADIPELRHESLEFLEINEKTKREICIACQDEILCRPCLMITDQLLPSSLNYRSFIDGKLGTLNKQYIVDSFSIDWQERLVCAFRVGRLVWPSPIDGRELRVQGAVCIDDFHFAYRFYDDRHGLVFFVLVGDHASSARGLWFPSLGLVVSGPEERMHGYVNGYLLQHLSHWIVDHICIYGALLAPYFSRGATRFASIMRGLPGLHIGHQLWNELSGIDHLVKETNDDNMIVFPTEWIVQDASQSTELYGAIDALYPEILGRVNRRISGSAALIRYIYETNTIPLRVTRTFVSKELRTRILNNIDPRLASRTLETRMALFGVHDIQPIILLGLRVENRTLGDLYGFLERMISFIILKFPKAGFVLDGHNVLGDREDGSVIPSFGESLGSRIAADAEQQLAVKLRERFSVDGIKIFDTVGKPVATSLAWASCCSCFISIWGASLSKYRWVCNLPGFVVTIRCNLVNRNDLRIYDSPNHMESPVPMIFADPDFVEDLPQSERLIDIRPGNPFFFNFCVDEDRLLQAVIEFIEDLMHGIKDREDACHRPHG